MVTANTTDSGFENTTLQNNYTGGWVAFDPALLTVMQVTGTAILILYIVGLFVNMLAFIVLIQAKKKMSTEYIFTVLTFADMMALASGVVISIVYTLIAFAAIGGDVSDLTNIVSRVDIVSYMGPYSITIIVSIERMFAVFRPVDFRNLWTPKMAKIVVLTGYTSTLIVYILLAATLNKADFLIARLVFITASVVSVVIANIITIIRLKQHTSKIIPANQNQANNFSKALARERRQTKVLIGISFLFVICGSATLADTAASMLVSNDFSFAFALFMSGSTRALFQVLNSTLNCVIYVTANPSFKSQFINIICCQYCKNSL